MGSIIRKAGKAKFYYRFTNPLTGKRQDKALSTDRQIAKRMAAKIDRDNDHAKLGFPVAQYAEHQRQSIHQHLADWRESLLDKGNGINHANMHHNRAAQVIAGCGFASISELDAAKIEKYLAQRRRQNKTQAEGKRSMGFGVKTSNHYMRAVKSFARWLWRSRRLPDDPLASLRQLNADVDRRHSRRVLSTAELQTLLVATKQSRRTDKGIGWRFTGVDRYMLYLTAANTGLRSAELASLTPSHFDFAKPTVTVKALSSKHRKQDVLQLRPELAAEIQAWIAARKLTGNDSLWGGPWCQARMAGKILKRDLQAAGIPYRNEQGEVYDFHALRAQFITMLVMSGVPPKVAQRLARHSTIGLTLDVYAKLRPDDVASALGTLPPMIKAE